MDRAGASARLAFDLGGAALPAPAAHLDQDGWSDWEPIEQLQMQRKLERLLWGEQ